MVTIYMNNKVIFFLGICVVFIGITFWFVEKRISQYAQEKEEMIQSQAKISSAVNSEVLEWKRFESKKYGFSFEYPLQYQIEESDWVYEGEPDYSLTVRNDEGYFFSVHLMSEKTNIPQEGGCWPYFAKPLDLAQSTEHIKRDIKKVIPTIEQVAKTTVGEKGAARFYCIQAYGATAGFEEIIIPLENRQLFTNMTLSGPILTTDQSEDVEQGIKNTRSNLIQKKFLENTDVKHNHELFEKILQSFRFVEVSAVNWKDVQFDACGGESKYSQLPWWKKFADQVQKVNYYDERRLLFSVKRAVEDDAGNTGTGRISVEAYCMSNRRDETHAQICNRDRQKKLSMEDDFRDYGEGCLAKDGTAFVAVFSGEYMGGGNHLFRYDIRNDVLEEAKKVIDEKEYGEYGWNAPPSKFGKRQGNVITMSGGVGDAGCGVVTSFDYDFIENTVEMTKRCGFCDQEEPVCKKF